jgi:hypothetical protein
MRGQQVGAVQAWVRIHATEHVLGATSVILGCVATCLTVCLLVATAGFRHSQGLGFQLFGINSTMSCADMYRQH